MHMCMCSRYSPHEAVNAHTHTHTIDDYDSFALVSLKNTQMIYIASEIKAGFHTQCEQDPNTHALGCTDLRMHLLVLFATLRCVCTLTTHKTHKTHKTQHNAA